MHVFKILKQLFIVIHMTYTFERSNMHGEMKLFHINKKLHYTERNKKDEQKSIHCVLHGLTWSSISSQVSKPSYKIQINNQTNMFLAQS